jgi:hypothetical protein
MSRAVSTGPGPAGWAGTASSEYAPGTVELARRVVTVLGGRYSAELGVDVGMPMNIARRNAELYEVKINAVLDRAADPREMVDYS